MIVWAELSCVYELRGFSWIIPLILSKVLRNSRISNGDFRGSLSDMPPTDPDLKLCQVITLMVVYLETVTELELVLVGITVKTKKKKLELIHDYTPLYK